ncbi:MAG: SprT family zinc-dependent metalloprotease [bacterium]|nr:SprT family zinc-dependent metalloprotease [bacterium]
MNTSRTTAWLQTWADVWGVPDLPDRLRVEYAPRLRRSLGRCTPATGHIRLHPALRDAGISLLKEVLCHEAAHAAVYLLYGAGRRPHGVEWARLMRAAGFEPRARVDEADLPDVVRKASQPRRLYRHRCPVCGTQRTARRVVRRWRCRRCLEAGLDGLLSITTLLSRTSEMH